MTYIYSKKENPYIYFGLSLALFAVFYAGIYYVNYYLWIVLPALAFVMAKGFTILKTPEVPVIKLDDSGITTIHENKGASLFYAYKDISVIKMQSNYLNGYLKLTGKNKKIILDSVAIPIDKQREIVNIVSLKISEHKTV
jgi:hypothetical protein